MPYPEPEKPTTSAIISDRLAKATAQVLDLLSLLLTGERRGRLRRPVLFLLVALGLGTSPWTLLTIIGLMAAMLLALTDTPVDA